MDGNLLDPETADETLAKEWNLPELPEGNSSLPSTSQELAEIFGTSDDEDDVDFPFSLSAGLPGELSLPNTNTKKFENSLLGNELFLTTFHDTLSGIPPVPVSISQNLRAMSASDKGGNSDKPSEKGEELTGANTGEKPTEQSKSTEVKVPAGIAGNAYGEPENSGDAKTEEEHPTQVLRKSARLRNRRSSDEERTYQWPVTAERVGKKSATRVKQEVANGARTVKEEPKVETEDKEQTIAVVDNQLVKEDLVSVNKENKRYVKSGDGNSDGESSDSGEQSEEESDEDPDRLWCICRQPHDDRFMICCDQCEEWYHGDCVGISVGQGKRMEREGKEYICPVCVARLQDAKEEREMNRSARQARRELAREKDNIKTKVVQVHRRISSGSSQAPKSEDDQYGMSQLFLPDNAPKEKKGGANSPTKPEQHKIKKEETATRHCIGPGCEKMVTPPTAYCSEECIEKHAAYALKKLSDRGALHSSNPSEFVRGAGGVSVVEKATGKLLVGIAAPSEKILIPWLKEHPSYQVYLHPKTGKKDRDRVKKKPKVEKKEPESPTSKMPKIPLMDPQSVRANAKRALFQTLWKRREDVADLSDLDEEAVEKVANDIEEKLHNLYQDINPKYKNKYRSLLFNLKDNKNPGLFRKVLRGEIDTRQLVRMSSEKLASEELSQWRVQTIKKDLDKIKEREEEAVSQGATIRKKTYKGDIEIETTGKADIIETIDITKEATKPGTQSNSQPNKSHSSSTKSHSQSKSQANASSKPKPAVGGILDLLTDTTSQHDNHIYDHHCAICTGKMKKPPPSPEPQTMEAAPDDDGSHPSPDSRTADNELMDTTSPDTANGGTGEDSDVHEEPSIWKGEFTMHGMPRFSTSAYAVSGSVEYLDEILPPVLEVMGRIAHVQVWDYVDKLRSSTSRDIVILRFDGEDEDTEAYLAMVNYLVGKHRCGVIKSGYHGIKDMYLLPLQRHTPVPPQLLPFDGPGLPYDHPDMLLGIIIRSKHRKHPSVSQRLASQSGVLAAAAVGPPPPLTVVPSSSETGIKRHNSASEEIFGGVKRTRFQLEIGIGDQTPPILGQTPPSFGEQEEKEKSADNSSYEPGRLDPVKEGEERLMKKIQMSFYGEHQPMESTSEKMLRDASSKAVTNSSGREAGGSQDPIPQPTSSSFQSFLSQLSKEKLEELASVVSSISGQPGSGEAPAGTGVSATLSQSPLKVPTVTAATVNYSSNPESTNVIPATSDVGGPQPQGQLGVNYSTASGQVVGVQAQDSPLPQPTGSYGEGQWNQEPVQQPPQQQQTQFYQTLQYPAEQQHPTAAAAVTAGSGVGGTPDQFQQHHQAYPIQGGAPYANYPLPVQNQTPIDTQQRQDGRATATAAVGHYAASQKHQQYSGDQYAAHRDSSHHPTPPQQGLAHQSHPHQSHAQQPHPTQGPAHQSHPPQAQWDQHQSYRQDYGNHSRSHYYEGHGGSGAGAGYREGYGEGRHPSSHRHNKAGGWDHGREHGGHQGHHFRGRGGHDSYREHWQRGNHERDRHWR